MWIANEKGLIMIYVTGDTHANHDIEKLTREVFPQQDELSRDDYVIVCGDFGLVWDGSQREQKLRQWMSEKNFTTLFVDGNHENFDVLRKIPLEDKFGGKVRQIAPNVYHLERGQVLTIDGKRFFAMGGASSHDKEYREEHISWWKEELPTCSEMERAVHALDDAGWEVDYVLTHCAPRSIQLMIADWYENDQLTGFLELVRGQLQFKRWFFGHYHIDRRINDQFIALYNKVLPVM